MVFFHGKSLLERHSECASIKCFSIFSFVESCEVHLVQRKILLLPCNNTSLYKGFKSYSLLISESSSDSEANNRDDSDKWSDSDAIVDSGLLSRQISWNIFSAFLAAARLCFLCSFWFSTKSAATRAR